MLHVPMKHNIYISFINFDKYFLKIYTLEILKTKFQNWFNLFVDKMRKNILFKNKFQF